MYNTSPEKQEIKSVHEGMFVNAELDGYGRVFSVDDATCEVGFWKEDYPWGKFVSYNLKGEELLCEGLYEGLGPDACKKKMRIANY